MDGANGNINFASDITRYTEYNGTENTKQTIKIDSLSGVIESRTTDGDVARITSQGIFANKAGYEVAGMGVSLKASIAGFGYGKMDKDMWGSNWGIVGVYGRANNSSSNPAPAYAGFFDGDTILNGLTFLKKGVTFSETILDNTNTYFYLNKSHFHVTHYGTDSTKYIYLPSSNDRFAGQMFMIVRINTFDLKIRGNGVTIFKGTGEYGEVEISNARNTLVLFFTGERWIANEISR